MFQNWKGMLLNPQLMKQPFPDIFSSSIFTFTSNRTIDFSLSDNKIPLNKIQQKYLIDHCGNVPIINIRQVHGDRVVLIDQQNSRIEKIVAQADALVTAMPQVVLAIRTADCLPVFIYDAAHSALGLVHAGWKGTQKKIIDKTIAVMKKNFQTQLKDITIALGPSIRRCCYEVESEFVKYFPGTVKRKENKYFFDMVKENKNQIASLGVSVKNIFDCRICTCCDTNYFSYRREGVKAGRMISVMMKKRKED